MPLTRASPAIGALTNLESLNVGYTPVGDAGIASLKALTKLTELLLDTVELTDAGVAHIIDFRNLKQLDLYHTLVTDKGLQQLKQALAGLRHSLLARFGAKARLIYEKNHCHIGVRSGGGVGRGGDDDLIAASVEKQGGYVVRDQKGNIIEVSLARTWATDADVERVAAIKTLKKLDLSLTYVSDAGAEAIGKLAQLEELNLFTAEFVTDAAIAYLRGNTNLRVLNLRGTDVTDTSLEYVARLTNLRSLDISFTQISDVGLEHLAALSQLETLNLGGMKISGVGLHVLKYLPNLKKLSFYGIQRRNAGMCWAPVMTDIELDTIGLLDGLEELNIGSGVALGAGKPAELGPAAGEAECRVAGGTRVTDVGVAKLANLKKLRYLDLSGSVVTAASAEDAGLVAESAAAELMERQERQRRGASGLAIAQNRLEPRSVEHRCH